MNGNIFAGVFAFGCGIFCSVWAIKDSSMAGAVFAALDFILSAVSFAVAFKNL